LIDLQEEVKAIPIVEYSGQDDGLGGCSGYEVCTVCLEEFVKGEQLRQLSCRSASSPYIQNPKSLNLGFKP
jgi:hypothetical protein